LLLLEIIDSGTDSWVSRERRFGEEVRPVAPIITRASVPSSSDRCLHICCCPGSYLLLELCHSCHQSIAIGAWPPELRLSQALSSPSEHCPPCYRAQALTAAPWLQSVVLGFHSLCQAPRGASTSRRSALLEVCPPTWQSPGQGNFSVPRLTVTWHDMTNLEPPVPSWAPQVLRNGLRNPRHRREDHDGVSPVLRRRQSSGKLPRPGRLRFS
jgi:hypothetical protein